MTDGTYTVQVRDANNIGCTISLPNIIIAPLPIEPALSSSVAYNCDGSGNITVLPSDPTYTYSIDGNTPQAGNVFNDVAVGNHTITVDYGSDCTVDTVVNVQAGNAFEASIIAYEDLDCNGDASGSITFEVDNFGAGGFEYSLDNFTTVLGSCHGIATDDILAFRGQLYDLDKGRGQPNSRMYRYPEPNSGRTYHGNIK